MGESLMVFLGLVAILGCILYTAHLSSKPKWKKAKKKLEKLKLDK